MKVQSTVVTEQALHPQLVPYESSMSLVEHGGFGMEVTHTLQTSKFPGSSTTSTKGDGAWPTMH